jgi:hypothetical protein
VSAEEYESMARLARSMLEEGRSNEEILRACYGVAFPVEALVIAEMILEDVEPHVSYLQRPWELLTPLSQGGPRPANVLDEDQQRLKELDSNLIGLVRLYGDGSRRLLCYRKEELAAGRSTVFALPEDLPAGCVAKQVGDSLGAVLREYHQRRVRAAEAEYASPGNRGAGSIDAEEVEGERQGLVRAEDLIALTADRIAGAAKPTPWKARSLAAELIAAAEKDDIPALRALIAQGVPVDPPEGQDSALQAAISKSRLASARFLLESGANLHHRGQYSGLTPLRRACRHSDSAMIELVIDASANVNDPDLISVSATQQERDRRVLSLLVKRGIDPNLRTRSTTLLMAICELGDLETARLLLDRGADPNASGRGSPLTVAEDHGHQVLVDLLLDRGAKPSRPEIAPDVEGDACWKAAREQPTDAGRRLAWAEALQRRGLRAAAARELDAAKRMGAAVQPVALENPPGTRWEFAAFEAPIEDVTSPIEDARIAGAALRSGDRTLPLAVLLGPPCTTCDEKAEVACSECNGTGVGDNYMTGGSFQCEPRMTCMTCLGLKYVVRASAFGKGSCQHKSMTLERPLAPIRSQKWTFELALRRCVDCGLPALRQYDRDEFACGVCGYFVCRCAR